MIYGLGSQVAGFIAVVIRREIRRLASALFVLFVRTFAGAGESEQQAIIDVMERGGDLFQTKNAVCLNFHRRSQRTAGEQKSRHDKHGPRPLSWQAHETGEER